MTVQNMTEPNGIEPLQVFMHTFEFLLQCTKLQAREFSSDAVEVAQSLTPVRGARGGLDWWEGAGR